MIITKLFQSFFSGSRLIFLDIKVMSEFKGTKGKWESMRANQMGVPYIIFVDNETIFQCYGENAKENMQVAKCAPEMLEMLKQSQSLIDKLSYANLITPDFMNECYNVLSENQRLIHKATN